MCVWKKIIITATHAQEKQKTVEMVNLAAGHIHSEVRGGRGEEEDEERGNCRAQWVITTELSIITPSEVCLCGDVAEEELFTAYLLIVQSLSALLVEDSVKLDIHCMIIEMLCNHFSYCMSR